MNQTAQCKLVIAGPGGGKTHNMVQKVLECMESLHPTRFCVVITYTNAATEEIKSRLSQKGRIPANVFIGTIHSFLNQFIFEPFAKLKGIINDDYFLIDKVSLPYKIANQFAHKNKEKSVANGFVDKGIITYDKLLEKAKDLIDDDEIAKKVSNRLQFVFVDEYQDIRLWQHDVFIKILLQDKTHFYCIGDPLQSIFKFAYTHSQNSKEKPPKNIKDTPIFLLEKEYGRCNEFTQMNRRSRPVIIDLIHNYTSKINLQQEKYLGSNEVPVFYIDCGKNRDKAKRDDKIELDFETKKEILTRFNSIIEKYQINKEVDKIYKLIVVKEWDTIKVQQNELNATELSDNKNKGTSYIQEISRCVLGIVGYKLSEIIDKKDLESVLKYRKFCLRILKKNPKPTIEQIKERFSDEFKEITKKFKAVGDAQNIDVINSYRNLVTKKEVVEKAEVDDNVFFSSTHSAKGLEATCVLVIAKTKNELEKWLNFEQCTSDDDDFRLGYVAFSRARQLLCIACLESIPDSLAQKIESLGFKNSFANSTLL
jgi:DNA helicase II / ATP-dependent DNA helicase PcrA